MNLSQLRQASSILEQGLAPKAKQAAQQPDLPPASRGFALLQQAKASGFSRPGLLKESLIAFQQALHLNPQHADALCGMAYLLALCGETERARQYAARVLEQDLDDDMAQSLWSSLNAIKPERRWSASIRYDFDSQYDALEQALKSQLRYFMHNQPQAQLSPEPEVELKLRQLYTDCSLFMDKVDQSLTLLERELETSALEQLRRPLQQHLKRLERQILAQDRHQQLEQIIQQGQLNCRQLMANQARLSEHDQQQQLEAILDACDTVADGIDALADEGWEFPFLLKHYRNWITEAQQLQELLDDSHS